MGNLDDVVIAIPTFRRTALLRKLLNSLASELTGSEVLIVVGDNDCGLEAPQVVKEFTTSTGVAAHCIRVPERGIAQVRNALISEALAERPGLRWVVMLDDDGWVKPGWPSALLAAADQYDADVAAGPVLGELPASAGRLARNSIYAGRVNHATGLVDMLNGAQNIAISRRIIDCLGSPWFQTDFGKTGGEDVAFFREVRARGGRFVWSRQSQVVEPTPPERLVARSLMHRIVANGMTYSVLEKRDIGWRRALARWLRDTFRALPRIGKALVLRDLDRMARCTLEQVFLLGRIAGLLGLRVRLYGGET